MIARCIDPDSIDELQYGWEYEIQPLVAHCVRVLIGDNEWIVCAADRFVRVLR